MANGIYFKKTVGQSRTFMSRENTNTKKPVARRVCRALMETTSGEEVFAFIAAAAGTGKKDDHQMEVDVQETGEPASTKQRSHPESHEAESLQGRVGNLDTTLTEHTQQLRTLLKQDTGQSIASEGSQATHTQTCTRFCLSIMRVNVTIHLQV